MQTSNSFVLLSWWCRANLVPRSALPLHKCENEAIFLCEWWTMSVSGSTNVCSLCTPNEKQMLNACMKKSTRQILWNNAITVRTFLRPNKKRAPFNVEETAFRLIYLWFLAASAAVSVNTFSVWMNYGTLFANRSSRQSVSQKNWRKRTSPMIVHKTMNWCFVCVESEWHRKFEDKKHSDEIFSVNFQLFIRVFGPFFGRCAWS